MMIIPYTLWSWLTVCHGKWPIYIYICMYVYVYIYIYIHTYTHVLRHQPALKLPCFPCTARRRGSSTQIRPRMTERQLQRPPQLGDGKRDTRRCHPTAMEYIYVSIHFHFCFYIYFYIYYIYIYIHILPCGECLKTEHIHSHQTWRAGKYTIYRCF